MDLPRQWRLRDQRYRLEGAECATCGAKMFPPRELCPQCHGSALRPYAFSGGGEVYSVSVLYQAPAGFEQDLPYAVALIKLDEGPIITAQLTDVEPESAQIGQRVEMVTRVLTKDGDDGSITYGYKFRPAPLARR